MNALESLAEGIKGELAHSRDLYRQSALSMLLANKLDDAKVLANKAEAISEAIGIVNSVTKKFKDPEDT